MPAPSPNPSPGKHTHAHKQKEGVEGETEKKGSLPEAAPPPTLLTDTANKLSFKLMFPFLCILYPPFPSLPILL